MTMSRGRLNLAHLALLAFGVLLVARAVPAALELAGVSTALWFAWIASGVLVPVACLVQRLCAPGRANTLALLASAIGYALMVAYAVLSDPDAADIGGGLVGLVGFVLLVGGGVASRPAASPRVPA